MELLLTDEPNAILESIGLIAVSLGLVLASSARVRMQREPRQIGRVFWHDVSQAGYVWAGATLVILLGALGKVEGLRAPVWLVAAILVGLACLVVARLRWLRHAAGASGQPVDEANPSDRLRLVSTSWEMGLLGAAAAGLVVYGATVSHDWGHPIHWLVAGIALAMGYAVGLVVATPRSAVRRRRA